MVLHAGAKRVWVDLSLGERDVTLSVRDDGRGITSAEASGRDSRGNHYGIETMRERVELTGGQIRIGPGPGGGTEVVARIPLDAAD